MIYKHSLKRVGSAHLHVKIQKKEEKENDISNKIPCSYEIWYDILFHRKKEI